MCIFRYDLLVPGKLRNDPSNSEFTWQLELMSIAIISSMVFHYA